MSDYSRKQTEAINRAWAYALDLADNAERIGGPMLKDALAYERKERSSVTAAKGLLLDRLAANPTTRTVAELYGDSRGLQAASIFAAHWNGDPRWEKIRNIIAEGAAAHREAIRARMDSLRS